MKVFFSVLVSLVFFNLILFAQSGRRITEKPAPTPNIVEDESRYSESRSYKPQRIYPPNYKNKNDKVENTTVADTAKIINPDDEDAEINIDSTLVTIPVSVYDRNGLYIPNIKQEEVKIFEDGKEQEIAYFKTSDEPFTVVLLIDTSPSTEYKIEEIRAAAKAFVDQLEPRDKVLVMEFDNDPSVLTEATNDRQKIYKAIDKADFGNGTALYDAVNFALNKRLNKVEGRKAIVLFTDGVDTVSRKGSFYSTTNDAEESETIIFPIYYNTFLENQRNNVGIFGQRVSGVSAEEYALGKKYLEDLAASTGGRVFQAENTFGGLKRAFEGIAEELRRQYNVGYYPEKEGKVGEKRQIKVRIYRPDLIVRARDSYTVGANKNTTSVK